MFDEQGNLKQHLRLTKAQIDELNPIVNDSVVFNYRDFKSLRFATNIKLRKQHNRTYSHTQSRDKR